MERLEKAKNWGVEVENEKRLAKLAKVILIVSLIASMLVIVLSIVWEDWILLVVSLLSIPFNFISYFFVKVIIEISLSSKIIIYNSLQDENTSKLLWFFELQNKIATLAVELEYMCAN